MQSVLAGYCYFDRHGYRVDDAFAVDEAYGSLDITGSAKEMMPCSDHYDIVHVYYCIASYRLRLILQDRRDQ